MGFLGTSNGTVLGAVQAQTDQNFKTVNNLLSLQDNHVEEFLNYHGQSFLSALEKMMEDITERVVSKMLNSLSFVQDSTTGTIKIHPDAMREFERITQENIDLDIRNILAVSLNQEVINQRKMAKQQYLESQGFSGGNMNNPQIHGGYNAYAQGQMAMNNGSGYPIPPAGQDNYGRPYWIDPQTGQMSYEPPSSGLGLGSAIQKGAAWAKWLM